MHNLNELWCGDVEKKALDLISKIGIVRMYFFILSKSPCFFYHRFPPKSRDFLLNHLKKSAVWLKTDSFLP